MTTVLPSQTAAPASSVTPTVPAPSAAASVTLPPSPAPRLVPASIGRLGRVQTAWVPCPDWCVVDHAVDRQVAVEDVSHRGAVDFVQVSTMGGTLYSVFELYCQLHSDPASDDPRMRVASVVVTDGSNDAYQTPDMADEFADSLIAFAQHVRALARTARAAAA